MSRVDRHYNNKENRRTVKNQNLYQDLKDYTNLKEEFIIECKKINIDITEELFSKLDRYKDLLIEWNQKFNLTTIIEELAGMNKLLFDQQHISFSLLCKLKGLFDLTNEDDFFLYRRMIFECLSLMNNLITECQD